MRPIRLLLLVALVALAGCGKPAAVPATPSAEAASPPRTVELLSAESCAQRWGLKMHWEAETRRATLSGGGRELICCAGLRSALIDGVPFRLQAPAEMREGKLMIPVGLATEAGRLWALRPSPTADAEAPKIAAVPVPAGPRIVVDPGHGGDVPTGCRGSRGTLEKDVNLLIALELKSALQARGCEVILLRESDCALYPPSCRNAKDGAKILADLEERVRLANEARAALFVSLHANHAADPDAEGFEIWYPRAPLSEPPPAGRSKGKARRKSMFDWSAYGSDTPRILERLTRGDPEEARWKESRDLAESVRKAMHAALSTPDRGTKMKDHKVTSSCNAPAILVETGFLSNPDEERRLQSPEYQRRVAEAVAEGIRRFLDSRKP